MYTIFANVGRLGEFVAIHSLALESEGTICVEPKLTERINSHGSLEFTVYPTNKYFDKIVTRKVLISLRNDDAEVWRGRIISTTRDINNAKKVYCEGELAYLCDSIQRPMVFNGTIKKLLQMFISAHNALFSAGSERRFELGVVKIGPSNSGSDRIECEIKEAATTWDCIQTYVMKTFGGYIYTRKDQQTGKVYIDIVNDFENESNQTVEFGKNMLSFSENIDASDVITVLEPYGALKNTPPVLYKQSSTNELKFNKVKVNTITSGAKYIIYANGGALNKTVIGTNKLHSTLLDNDAVSEMTDDYIILESLSRATLWTITRGTTPGTDVNVSSSGSLSKSISLQVNGYSIAGVNESTSASGGSVSSSASSSGAGSSIAVYDDNNNYIGKTGNVSLGGSGSGTISTTAKTATTANDAWRIHSGNDYLAANGKAGQLVLSTASGGKETYWQISNDDSGAKIVSKYNSDMDVPATIHGDVDRGWGCYENANGDYTPAENQTWDGNRVNLSRESSFAPDGRVTSDVGTSLFGFIYGTKVFDAITTPFELLSFAQNYIYAVVLEKTSISCSAVDISFTSEQIDALSVGWYSRTIIQQFPVNIRLLCTQKTTFLLSPGKTKIVFGAGQKTLTDIQGGMTTDVRYT